MGVGWNQGFAFDKHTLSKVHRAIHRSESPESISYWKNHLPMGPNAVEGNISYLKHLRVYDTKRRELTSLGKIIADHDPGWSDKGTLFLLYYEIATNKDATVWYQMTNTFIPKNRYFNKKEAKNYIKRHVSGRGISKDNAKKDVNFYLRSVTEPDAFGDLRIIRKSSSQKGEYIRRTPRVINPLIFSYCLYRQRKRKLNDDNSVEVNRLLRQDGGVGKAFNLYESKEEFMNIVEKLRSKGILSYVNTANLNDIEFLREESNPLNFVDKYYRNGN